MADIEQQLNGPTQRIRQKHHELLSDEEKLFDNMSMLIFTWNHGGIYGVLDLYSADEIEAMIALLRSHHASDDAAILQQVYATWYGDEGVPFQLADRQNYKEIADPLLVEKVEAMADFNYVRVVNILGVYARSTDL